MKIKAISEQLAKLFVAAAFAAATSSCQRSQPSGLNEWGVLLSDRVQVEGLDLRLDGTSVQLPQRQSQDGVKNEMIAKRPASQKLRVELFQQGKSIIDFTADWTQGNAIRLFSDAAKGIGVSQGAFRNATVRTRTSSEVAADLLLHRTDSQTGATVCLNIPETGWLFLKVPTNQPTGILKLSLPGNPTVLLSQTFID